MSFNWSSVSGVPGIVCRPCRITAVRRSSVGGAPLGIAFSFVSACNPGPFSGRVDVG